MRRQPTDDALDRSPDILRRCDDERTSQKQHGGEDVVQPEEHIVRVDVLDLEVSLESSKQLIHVGWRVVSSLGANNCKLLLPAINEAFVLALNSLLETRLSCFGVRHFENQTFRIVCVEIWIGIGRETNLIYSYVLYGRLSTLRTFSLSSCKTIVYCLLSSCLGNVSVCLRLLP